MEVGVAEQVRLEPRPLAMTSSNTNGRAEQRPSRRRKVNAIDEAPILNAEDDNMMVVECYLSR